MRANHLDLISSNKPSWGLKSERMRQIMLSERVVRYAGDHHGDNNNNNNINEQQDFPHHDHFVTWCEVGGSRWVTSHGDMLGSPLVLVLTIIVKIMTQNKYFS